MRVPQFVQPVADAGILLLALTLEEVVVALEMLDMLVVLLWRVEGTLELMGELNLPGD